MGRTVGVMASAPEPVSAGERLETLDLLRGCAAPGILLMNVRLFAGPAALAMNPTALGLSPSPSL